MIDSTTRRNRAAYGTALPGDGDADAPRFSLGFLRDREALIQRFLLAEVLAPPLALRRGAQGRGPGSAAALPARPGLDRRRGSR